MMMMIYIYFSLPLNISEIFIVNLQLKNLKTHGLVYRFTLEDFT